MLYTNHRSSVPRVHPPTTGCVAGWEWVWPMGMYPLLSMHVPATWHRTCVLHLTAHAGGQCARAATRLQTVDFAVYIFMLYTGIHHPRVGTRCVLLYTRYTGPFQVYSVYTGIQVYISIQLQRIQHPSAPAYPSVPLRGTLVLRGSRIEIFRG